MAGRWTRRSVALSAVAFLSGTAGCGALSSDGGGAPRTAYLASLTLENADFEERTLHVFVERDGEPVYWRTHRLGPHASDSQEDRVDVEPTWDVAQGGEYVVYARVDDRNDWRTFDLTELPPIEGEDPPYCEGIELRVSGGQVDVLYGLDAPETCPDGG